MSAVMEVRGLGMPKAYMDYTENRRLSLFPADGALTV
jgi:hypothetical protein